MSRSGEEAFRGLQRLGREGWHRNTQILLELFVHERFLARLASSRHGEGFVLKGGMLMAAMGARRPTRDADLLALRLPHEPEVVKGAVSEIAKLELDDGVCFDPQGITATEIRQDADYSALRISLPATVAQARLKLTVDVNFGDPIAPREIDYPTILDEDRPFRLLGYAVESVLAEKGETMIAREDANTRLRDYADVMRLGQVHNVKLGDLHDELMAVATHRKRALKPLASALDTLPTDRQPDWVAFRRRAQLEAVLPERLQEVVDFVIALLDPAILGDEPGRVWHPHEARWK